MSEAWKETTLGALLTLEYGKALPERHRSGSGSPVFGSNGIVGWHSQPLVTGPGIIVGRKGTAGSVTWSDAPFFPIDTTYWVSIKDEAALDLRFAGLLLVYCDLPAICAQTGVPGLNRDRAYEVVVALPPLPVQRRIVDLMEHLDTHIANLEVEIRDVGRCLASARAEFFSPLTVSRSLDEVCRTIKAGGTPSRKSPKFYGPGFPWLKSGEVDSPDIQTTEETITRAGLDGSSAWLVPANTVVVAMYGATAGVVGFISREMATNQAVLALIADPEVAVPRFLYHWLKWRSPDLKAAASGAAQPNLSKQVVVRVGGFPDLGPGEQIRLSVLMDALESQHGALKREASALRAARFSVLPELLSGEAEIAASYDDLAVAS